jgi:hypothetical protein
MSGGAVMMALAIVLTVGTLAFLLVTMARSIQVQKTGDRSIWREFGLGLTLMILFFATWIGHLIAQWQSYTDQQAEHGASTSIGDFAADFGRASLENWQSEFLQLFSFVVLAALYIHKGSAESKDSDEKMEASLRRIEEKLGTLPPTASDAPGESFTLPDTELRASG